MFIQSNFLVAVFEIFENLAIDSHKAALGAPCSWMATLDYQKAA